MGRREGLGADYHRRMADLTAPSSVAEMKEALAAAEYLADEPAALVSFLAQRLGKPVLVEGPAGVGKTELAKALSRASGRELIRLQCYEGLDESKALYEWNYRKQLLAIQAAPGRGDRPYLVPLGRARAVQAVPCWKTSSPRISCSSGR